MKNTIYRPVEVSKRLPQTANENYLTISERGVETSRFFNGKRFETASYEGEITHWLEKIKITDLEEVKEIKLLAYEGLPSQCVNGFDEIKFCSIRNGDGNMCQKCSDYR